MLVGCGSVVFEVATYILNDGRK